MEQMRSIGADDDGGGIDVIDRDTHADTPPAIGTDERRMHVRAYNFWVSLLRDRTYPAIADLDPAHAADFGPHSVLLDFTRGSESPAIGFLGNALRIECGVDGSIASIADIPARSLLSRLTDHYLQILANRAPIGFEAEFVSQRGNYTMYRGILMPFSSDDETIDYVYGVINWKELADPNAEGALVLEMDQVVDGAVPHAAQHAVWADGPGAGLDEADEAGDDIADDNGAPAPNAGLVDHLAAARALAERAQRARINSRAALYRALGLAYDFALVADVRPEEYRELLADAGVRTQARAPMTAVVRLVFGANVDKARATEFAAALAHARRIALPAGRFASHVEGERGGLKALVAAERAARRPVDARRAPGEAARNALRRAAPLAHVDVPAGDGEFVLLLARREEDGRLAVVAPVPAESGLVDRAIRNITR